MGRRPAPHRRAGRVGGAAHGVAPVYPEAHGQLPHHLARRHAGDAAARHARRQPAAVRRRPMGRAAAAFPGRRQRRSRRRGGTRQPAEHHRAPPGRALDHLHRLKPEERMNYRFAAASLALVVLLGAAPAGVWAKRANEPITLNFQNAEIDAVARTMAAITGRNIVVDPRVKGTITLSTDRPVPPAAAFNQFVSTLRLSGFAVVDSGGLLKVVPEAEAKLQSGAVSVDGTAGGSQIVTQVFRLNFESAANLVPILRPLISPNNTINVNPGNNSLVITDYADNLQRLGRIIAALDVSNATDVEVINLHDALAVDLAPIVQRLVDASSSGVGGAPAGAAAGQSDTGFRTTVIAEARSNSLIVRAPNPARLNLVRSIVARLDVAGAGGASGNVHVVYLRNADATRLAIVLRAALASLNTNPNQVGGSAATGSPSAGTPITTAGLSGGGTTG